MYVLGLSLGGVVAGIAWPTEGRVKSRPARPGRLVDPFHGEQARGRHRLVERELGDPPILRLLPRERPSGARVGRVVDTDGEVEGRVHATHGPAGVLEPPVARRA